jgi:hypothetical protein
VRTAANQNSEPAKTANLNPFVVRWFGGGSLFFLANLQVRQFAKVRWHVSEHLRSAITNNLQLSSLVRSHTRAPKGIYIIYIYIYIVYILNNRKVRWFAGFFYKGMENILFTPFTPLPQGGYIEASANQANQRT